MFASKGTAAARPGRDGRRRGARRRRRAAATTTPTAGPTTAPAASARASAARAPAPSTGYTGPAVTIAYAIWGDPAELNSQQAIVDAFHAANPKITVEVTVSDWDAYWDKLQTGLAGGAAPDVFAMDGPLFPDYQSRDVLLDLKPFIDRDGYDLAQLADQGGRGLHDGRRRPVRPAARPQRDRPLLQQGHVRRRRRRLPGRHLGLGQARRGRQAAHQGRRRRRHRRPVGLLHRDDRHGELWSSLVWQTGGDIMTDGQDEVAARHARGRRRDPVPPGPDLEGEGHARAGALRRDRRRLRAGQAAMEVNGSWLVPTHEAAGIDLGIAPLPRARPAGHLGQPDRRRRLQGHQGARRRLGVREVPRQPRGAGDAHAAARRRCRSARRSSPARTRPRSTAPRSSPTRSPYAHLKPSFVGYNEFTTILQESSTRTSSTRPTRPRPRRSTTSCPSSSTPSSRPAE